ncbi:MAG: hypothetical protein H7X99_06530, partial [Saprospiraceae bacterium]|nr:hypothetical protein [Saprospiraceae bacterium]
MRTLRIVHLLVAILSYFSVSASDGIFHNENEHKISDEKKELVCSVSNFVVTPATGICNGELLELNFTFTGTDFGLNGYTLQMLGGWTHSFSIGDPQTFSEIALCNEEFVFTIYDNDNPACSATYTYGQVCCPCDIDVDIAQGECFGFVSSAILTIIASNGSCTNYNPTLTINGDPYPLEYIGSNDYQVDNISRNEEFLTYVICTNVPGLNECFTYVLENPCFGSIDNFSAELNENFCEDDSMAVTFSFDGDNFGLDGFTISTNTGYSQSYQPGDPYVITLPATCSEIVILTIVDDVHSWHYDDFVLGQVCCPCNPVFNVTAGACMCNNFNLSFVIDSISGSCVNYNWSLTLNGQAYELRDTIGGYIALGIHSSDSMVIYELCSLVPGLPECFSDTIVNPCFL